MTDQQTYVIPTASQIASKIVAKLFSTLLLICAILVGLKIAIELGGPWGIAAFVLLVLAGLGYYYWSQATALKLPRVDELIRARGTTAAPTFSKCGAALPGEFRFCPHCGTSLLDSSLNNESEK